jgi:hypothetical protein
LRVPQRSRGNEGEVKSPLEVESKLEASTVDEDGTALKHKNRNLSAAAKGEVSRKESPHSKWSNSDNMGLSCWYIFESN